MSKLAALIGQASNPISRAPKRLREAPVTLARERRLELEAMLHIRDGFVAVDGALLVRPSVTVAAVHGIDEWNQLTLWRTPYTKHTEVCFFASDRFGNQFGAYKDEIVVFDGITGQSETIGFGLERWAEYVLDQPEVLGNERVTAWQQEHGPMLPSQALAPRVPPGFAESDDSEFQMLEQLELMRRIARLHKETREAPGILPEGFAEWWWTDA